MDNPHMLYRCPGPETFEGVACETTVVEHTDLESHLADGWHRGWIAAGEAYLKAKEAEAKKVVEEIEDKAAATREEAIQKLEELGVVFDRRLGLSKLLSLIEGEFTKRQGQTTPADAAPTGT